MPVKLLFTLLLMMPLYAPSASFAEQAVLFQPVVSVYTDGEGNGLLQPEGVACTENTLVIADTGNNRLLQYTVKVDAVEFASQIKMTQLTNPIRVQINSQGEIFALDGKNRRIVRLNKDGQFAGNLDLKGMPPDTGATIVPRSFKIDQQDNIYVLDIFSGRVIVLNPRGDYLRQIAFPKKSGFFSDLTVDHGGSVYLIDSANSMVYSAAKEAAEFLPLSKNMQEYISFPTCITTDNRGVLYVTDQNGGSIILLGLDGSFRSRKAGMGWNEGLLNYPAAMCITGTNAFIADRNNNRVQVFR